VLQAIAMFKKIILTVFVLLVTLIVTLQFPKLYLNKQFEYKTFAVYSNDHTELNGAVENVLDSVITNLKESKFYQEHQKLELYFVKGTLYEKLIGFFGAKNIASAKFEKHIYIGKPNFEKNILLKENNEYEWVNLIQIISHEGVHSQMYKDYSRLGFMKTPAWINEGYSEYISYRPIREQSDYKLSDLVKKYDDTEDLWMKTEYNSMTPAQYVRDRILMEYLIDIKQMDILEIINEETLNPEKLLDEIRTHTETDTK